MPVIYASVFFAPIFVATGLWGLCAVEVEARTVYVNDGITEYRDWLSRSSSFRRKVNNLEDEPVEEFEIPILFGVSLGDITENFGDPRGGGTRLHEGLDMLAPKGTPIVSPTDAVVMKTGNGPSSGFVVYTANPGDETFVYMHLDKIADIESGDVLKPGDIIGYVGDTGNANGIPHLHFEIRNDTEATDPYPRIQKEYDLKEKIEILDGIFDSEGGDTTLANFLVDTYAGDFIVATQRGIDIPAPIERAMEKKGIDGTLEGISRVLKNGMEGSDVAALQAFLINLNIGSAARMLTTAGATGYFGSVTEAALREYQRTVGYEVNGVYTPGTKTPAVTKITTEKDATDGHRTTTSSSLKVVGEVLTSDLALGDMGASVQVLQLFLIIKMSGPSAFALLDAGPTGYFGDITRAALIEYQNKHGLTSSGVYNSEVRANITKEG